MKQRRKTFASNLITYLIVIAAYIACQFLLKGNMMTRSLKGQLVPICVYVVLTISLNLTVGISGELSLGHAGFMSVGAFAGIVMSAWLSARFGLENAVVRLILSMIVGGIFAGLMGVLIGIPVLRLRGDYLAIVTLAFGEIIRNVLNCLYISMGPGTEKFVASATDPNVFTKTYAIDRVHAQLFNAMDSDWTVVVNGPAGATGVEKIATFGMGFALILLTSAVYYLSPSQPPKWRYIFPGALLSTSFWMLYSVFFSYYVDHMGNYSVIYGSIGAIIAFLIWLNLSLTALLLGAVFNQALRETAAHEKLSSEI